MRVTVLLMTKPPVTLFSRAWVAKKLLKKGRRVRDFVSEIMSMARRGLEEAKEKSK